jgi:hypothetical protein
MPRANVDQMERHISWAAMPKDNLSIQIIGGTGDEKKRMEKISHG